MGDDGAWHRPPGVDEEVAGVAIEARFGDAQHGGRLSREVQQG
jgi:hypothetical protein